MRHIVECKFGPHVLFQVEFVLAATAIFPQLNQRADLDTSLDRHECCCGAVQLRSSRNQDDNTKPFKFVVPRMPVSERTLFGDVALSDGDINPDSVHRTTCRMS